MEKECKKCGLKKDLKYFRNKKDKNGKYYKYSYCIECEKEYKKQYAKEHKEYLKQKNKKYRTSNKEKIKLMQEKYKAEGYYKTYRANNIDKYKKYSQTYRQKRINNPISKLKTQVKDVVRNAFRRKGYAKNTKTSLLLGCDYNVFIKYLLETFKNNYGHEYDGKEEVHIDHIIPLATAKTKEDVIRLSYYTNLQLLKAKDNLKKGKRINYNIDYNSKEV